MLTQKTHFKVSLVVFLIFCQVYTLQAQQIIIRSKPVAGEKFSMNLEKNLKAWDIVELSGLSEAPSLNTINISMELGNRNLEMKGIHQPLTDQFTKLVEIGSGFRRERTFPQLLYFNSGDTRITIGKDFMLGEFRDKGISRMIEQLSNFAPGADKNLYVIYDKSAVVIDEKLVCGNIAGKSPESQKLFPSANNNTLLRETVTGECKTVEIAVMANSTTYLFHGSSLENTATYIASIYNLTEGDYVNEFTNDFRFKINELVVSTSAIADPWVHTDDIVRNLSNFNPWANTGFKSTNDLNSYWFNTKNFSFGSVGYAYVGYTCNFNGDAAIREYGASAQTMRCLLSHEHGHNFNLNHDAAGAQFIMAPNVNPTAVNFSPQSKTVFDSYLAGSRAVCITPCDFVDCERVAPLNLSISYQADKNEIQSTWSKQPDEKGYIIRWWPLDNPVIKTDTIAPDATSHIIKLSCSNSRVYRVEVARLCLNGKPGNFTGVQILNTSIPIITPGGSTSICGPDGVLLTSNLDQGNQWYKNGIIINDAISKTLLVKSAGTYEVRSNSPAGCAYSSLATTVVENVNPVKPRLTPSGTAITCAGTPFILTSSSDIGNQWMLNGLPITNAKAKTYAIFAGSGDYSVQVTNTFGCVALSDTIKVTVQAAPPRPQISAGRSYALCPGEEILLTSSSATDNQWYRNNKLIQGATGKTYKTIDSGKYSVVVTNNVGCTTTSAVVTVTLYPNPPKPIISPAGDQRFCAGGSLVITSSANAGNQWYKNGVLITGATAKNYSATETGKYTVKVSNAGGCFGVSDTVNVTANAVPAVPQVTAGGTLQLCPGTEVTLTSSATEGNQWYKDNVVINGAALKTLKIITAGNYKVRVTGSNNCFSESAVSAVVLVAAPKKPVITAGGPTSFCPGGNTLLSSDAAAGNQWYKSGVLITGATAKNYTASEAGKYTVKVSNASGCFAVSDTVNVTLSAVPAVPQVTASGSLQLCPGKDVTLTSSASAGNQWYRDNIELSGATLRTLKTDTAGNYTVRVTGSNKCFSQSAVSAVIRTVAPQKPVITAGGPTTFCAGGSTLLSSDAPSGNQWLKDGTAISGATAVTYQATADGQYSVRVTNGGGCTSASTNAVTVKVNPNPPRPIISAAGDLRFCDGGSVVLSSSASAANQWYKSGVPITGATAKNYTAAETGKYTVKVSNANGCIAVSDTVTVTVSAVPAVPQVTAGGALQLCPGSEVTLTSSASEGNQWYRDNILINGAAARTVKINTAGNYKVRVTGTNNCFSESAVSTVIIIDAPQKPVITAGGPTTICAGGNTLLTSNAAAGNQWLKDGTAISGATAATYQATAEGQFSLRVTNAGGCTSVSTNIVTVKVNPNPAKPSITWNGSRFNAPTGFAGYLWQRDGVEIPGADKDFYQPLQNGLFKVTVKDNNNCIAVSDEFNLVVTGLTDLRVGDAVITCYPNPAREAIYINVSNLGLKKLTVRLYDLNGRLMMDKILSNNRNTLLTDHLPSGIYHLLISNGKENSVLKIALIK